jgi:hemolysin III
MKKQKKYNQTILEEIANSITHGIGLCLSILGLVILLTYFNQNEDPWKLISFSIYGICLIILYLSSTIYHALTHHKTKAIFKQIDHSAIYLLIAGTYTPVTLISLRESWAIYLLPIIWIMAITGIYLKIFYKNKYENLSLILYLTMGWLAVIAVKPLFYSLPIESFIWIFIGGLSYTSGVIFYKWIKLPYHHTIWHVFVLLGSISHFISILYIA